MNDQDRAPLEPAHYESLKDFFEQQIRFNAHLGMRIDAMHRGHARVRIPYRQEFLGDPWRPALHGGLVSTIVDTAGGLAAFTAVSPDDRLSTVDLRVDYLRPAGLMDVIADAWVLRVGNRVAVCDVIAYQEDPSVHIATGKGVYNVRRAGE